MLHPSSRTTNSSATRYEDSELEEEDEEEEDAEDDEGEPEGDDEEGDEECKIRSLDDYIASKWYSEIAMLTSAFV